MRHLILAAIILTGLSATASAQQCEEMVIRSPDGTVISNSVMCVGLDGAWAEKNAPLPPASATVGAPKPVGVKRIEAPKPVYVTPLAASTPIAAERRALQPPTTSAPEPNTRAFTPVFEPTAVKPAAPAVVIVNPPAPAYQPEQPALLSVPAPSSVPAPTQVIPTEIPAANGAGSDRHSTYAKLGLVCVADQAMDCRSGGCGGLCAGQTGWCDGLTGEAHASLAEIERVYCRKK